ncbi:hypothetical protein [Pontibacter chinhatensis]|uniref:Outer membrane protein beta-barrel domain-containing protein n=1 Tax=Pontibacter chinhatensis TaxID=1436961 RepID=A0A1I2TB92_9BACT|nr:hypothetical protein [Pontibacter chinhatensis]SFG62142.1 hypothetical protein SAMN05421739_10354 [Pontibacter chinhatensis]
MKTNFILAALAMLSFNAFGQSDEAAQTTELVSLTKLEAGLHGIGVGYEVPFSSKWSVNLSAGLGGGYAIEKNSYANGFNSTFILNEPVAYLRSEFKYTYNRDKRIEKSKSTLHNAGNYVAFQTKYTTSRVFGRSDWNWVEEPLNKTLLNEVHWGMQRPLGQRFISNLHLGLGYATDFDFGNSQLYPAVGLQFAYVISKSSRL